MVSHADYRALAAFRYEMRKFLAWSEQTARAAELEPQQHQLLLAVKGLPADREPTIGAVAERLCVEHHTAVALVDKLEASGLIQRDRSTDDRRKVLLTLRPAGAKKLAELSRRHKAHLVTTGEPLLAALQAILGDLTGPKAARPRRASRKDPAR
jgi:DNA-binding MarR family transcriptional regulator